MWSSIVPSPSGSAASFSTRVAEGTKQSFQFQSWPESAALLERLGANTRLGIPGTVQEKIRDVPAATNDEFQSE